MLQLVAVLINPLLGASAPNWRAIPPLGEVAAWIAIFLVFSGPLGEEPGWRGFALPRMLERQGALAASLLLGVLWSAWHLPLGLVGDLTLYGSINAVLAAVVFTWLWQNTGGSVLLAILMHASHQNSVRYLGRVYEGADQVQQQWIAVTLWALVALAIVLIHGRERFAPKGRGIARLVRGTFWAKGEGRVDSRGSAYSYCRCAVGRRTPPISARTCR